MHVSCIDKGPSTPSQIDIDSPATFDRDVIHLFRCVWGVFPLLAFASMSLPPVRFGTTDPQLILPTITPYNVALCFLVKGYLSPSAGDPRGTWRQRQALGDALLTAIRRCHSIFDANILDFGNFLKVRRMRRTSQQMRSNTDRKREGRGEKRIGDK